MRALGTLLLWITFLAQPAPVLAASCGIFSAKPQSRLISDAEFSERVRLQAANDFETEFAPWVSANRCPYDSLPEGLEPSLRIHYEQLFDFMRQPRPLFEELQSFEQDVIARARKDGLTLERSLEREILDAERALGFQEASLTYEFLPQSVHLDRLREMVPLKDFYYVGKPKGFYTQRITLILAGRFLEKVSGDKNALKALLIDMGDEGKLPSYDWRGTGLSRANLKPEPDGRTYPDLFGYIFDIDYFGVNHSWKTNDYRNPDVVHRLKQYTPGLRGWY